MNEPYGTRPNKGATAKGIRVCVGNETAEQPKRESEQWVAEGLHKVSGPLIRDVRHLK